MKRNYTLLYKTTNARVVLSFADCKKIVSFVQLLMAINNRVSANSTSLKQRKSGITKRKNDKIALQLNGKSSLKRRALLFLKLDQITHILIARDLHLRSCSAN